MPLRPPPLGEKPLWRTSSIRNPFQVTENSGYGEGVVSFTCGPGGAWGAAGNGGVPVLRGLGGCSGTGAHFQGGVGFLTQAAELSPTNRPGFGPVLPIFAAFLVHFFLPNVTSFSGHRPP